MKKEKNKKPFTLPSFSPVLKAAGPDEGSTPPSDRGCRLEPNSLYVRYWISGTLPKS